MFRNEQYRKHKPSTLLVIGVFLCVLVAASTQFSTINQNTRDISWITWITGNSLSYDFHYLDLLELLYRRHDNSEGQ